MTPEACPAGTYNDKEGIESENGCQLCPDGAFCPVGTIAPNSCPTGFYSEVGGLTRLTDCRKLAKHATCDQTKDYPDGDHCTCDVGYKGENVVRFKYRLFYIAFE